ncbi:hypothetical protein CERSUDRAFT_111654 [Gelatoporia subvermispora B]|uniref:Uncharacterized protein n=1 Tax=Ceriporiopsis subvermispora (strain B) TaxID=914234 RepID=M2RQD3_CERS8|nr:hypothetical protein CERSUDRAFT_111654 [Gelatoporia subvermispora B]
MAYTEKEELLRILESHGQQFLGSFGSFAVLGKRKETTAKEKGSKGKKRKIKTEAISERDEWSGFGSGPSQLPGESDDEEDQDDELDIPLEDNRPQEGPSSQANVVVFSDPSRAGPSNTKTGKAQMKAFMSSKVAKVTQEVENEQSEEEASDEEDDLTNAQNDALLHRLVHTRILSGSLNPELDLTPAQRKKALAGRVLEVSGQAKLGKGETTVRTAEHNKAAKRVRDGIADKQKERSKKELEEAKHLGNYHPALKKLYDASAQSKQQKRERGLRMGVGSFKGGILKLSKHEIDSVRGGGSRGRHGSRKRGGKK